MSSFYFFLCRSFNCRVGVVSGLLFVITMLAGFTVRAGESSATADGSIKIHAIRLGIAGFKSGIEPNAEQSSALLADLLTARLSQVKEVELVERQAMDRILQEMSLSLSQPMNAKEAVRVGKLTGAEWLLIGSRQKLGGVDSLLIKIFDAQTGAIRDLTLVPLQSNDPNQTVDRIVGFVKNSTQIHAQHERRIVFGVGNFEDLSADDRFSSFGRTLRTTLESSYQGTRVSFVERSQLDDLYRELRLNLAGLTETNSPDSAIRPAFVLVDGIYRTFQDNQFKISLVMRVQKIGDVEKTFSFQEIPGAELDSKIFKAIDTVMVNTVNAESSALKEKESQEHFQRGKALSTLWQMNDDYYWIGGYLITENKEKRRQNVEAAVQEFRAALLLRPEWVEAKMYLAICLSSPDIDKPAEARDYYQEVISTSADPRMVELAHNLFIRSYLNRDDREAIRLLSAEAEKTTDPDRKISILNTVGEAAGNLFRDRKISSEERLDYWKKSVFAYCERDVMRMGTAKERDMDCHSVTDSFFNEVSYFLPQDAANKYIEKTGAEMVEKFPALEIYIVGTECIRLPPEASAIRNRLRELITDLAASPEKIKARSGRNGELFFRIVEQCMSEKLYDLAEKAGKIYSTCSDQSTGFLKYFRIYMAYCDREQGRWREALAAFESMGKLEILIVSKGPWGGEKTMFSAERAAVECRKHLGLASEFVERPEAEAEHPPIKFPLGKSLATLGQKFLIACDGKRIWMADGCLLFEYDKEGKSYREIELPDSVERQITCICVGKEQVWFGTAGSGILELNKQTGQILVYRDGLLLPNITALFLSGKRLWIGYGKRKSGGMGFMDVETKQITGLGLALTEQSLHSIGSARDFVDDVTRGAPQGRVVGFTQVIPDELWVLVRSVGLKRYNVTRNDWKHTPDEWNSVNSFMIDGSTFQAVAATPKAFVTVSDSYGGGIDIYDREKLVHHEVAFLKWLPEDDGYRFKGAKALALDGDHVWAGGEGFLALIDIPTAKVERLCDLRKEQIVIHSLQVEGDDLWVSAGNKLYRLSRQGVLSLK